MLSKRDSLSVVVVVKFSNNITCLPTVKSLTNASYTAVISPSPRNQPPNCLHVGVVPQVGVIICVGAKGWV